MSKHTIAVIAASAAELAPWGDDAWRFSGAIQLVDDGPPFLHARWTTPGIDPATEDLSALDTMVLRDTDESRAADIAVMAFTLLRAPGWEELRPWWDGEERRNSLRARLERVAVDSSGQYKLAVVELHPAAVPASVTDELERLGFAVVRFIEATSVR